MSAEIGDHLQLHNPRRLRWVLLVIAIAACFGGLAYEQSQRDENAERTSQPNNEGLEGQAQTQASGAIMQVANGIILAKDIPNGFTWTLASRLGRMLNMAEDWFGPRDKSYTLLGWEFSTHERPEPWYPGNCKHIIIQLTQNAALSEGQAMYQAAHEIVHILAPSVGIPANVLEEGLATTFSASYMNDAGLGPDWRPSPADPASRRYQEAAILAQKLLDIDPTIIKRIREKKPSMSQWTSGDLLVANPAIKQELADALTRPF